MRLIFISLTYFLLISNYGFGQADLCQKIYVLDFKTVKNERDFLSNTLSNEVEDALSQIDDCKILQRRKYADIQKQVDNEIQISNVEDLSDDLRKKLKTIQAERVLFGEIEQDFSFNVNLRLRLENLYTKQIKTTTVLIEGDKMIDPSLRTEVIHNAITEFLNISNPTKTKEGKDQDDSKGFQFTKTIDNFKFEIIETKRIGEQVDFYFLITNLDKEDRALKFIPHYNVYFDDKGDKIAQNSKACISKVCNSNGYGMSGHPWRQPANFVANLMPSDIPMNAMISVRGVSEDATKFIRADLFVWISDTQHKLQLSNVVFPQTN